MERRDFESASFRTYFVLIVLSYTVAFVAGSFTVWNLVIIWALCTSTLGLILILLRLVKPESGPSRHVVSRDELRISTITFSAATIGGAVVLAVGLSNDSDLAWAGAISTVLGCIVLCFCFRDWRRLKRVGSNGGIDPARG
ncbi:hypothetical protein [Aeromicrobium sp.]|uniref:hypothetical protein n=1 Tax=Aeromicrobium sp. TaxID=1871063 RepID=UPI003D6BCB49